MCIAIYSLKGNAVPDDKTLKNCFNYNDDGAGFAFNYKGRVEIRKGYMEFEDFITAFHEYDKTFNFKNRGVLIHFRITTHGGTSKGCCHPFPISTSNKHLKKTKTSAGFAVIHNGIIDLTSAKAREEGNVSDTMVFIRDYLTRIASHKGWFNKNKSFKLIHDVIDSKMAILNSQGEIHSTEGFEKGEDGNYYSNESYKDHYSLFRNWGYRYYDYGFNDFDVDMDGYSLMRLKKGETVYYDDGTTEEYDEEYHSNFPTFMSTNGNIYACYDGKRVGRVIDVDRLTFVGTGGIFNDKQLCFEIFNPSEFRNDVTVFRCEYDDVEWALG